MFQVAISHEHEDLTTQLSFAWFVRNVTTIPFAISKNRTLVKRDSLTWSAPAGSLAAGLKLIEFEVSLSSSTAVRRDLAFIKVEEPSLVALINGGSESLVSSIGQINISADDSFDPGIGENRHSGMSFSWICLNGGQLLPHSTKGNSTVLVPSESSKKNASTCTNGTMSNTRGKTAVLRPRRDGHRIYFIKLLVKKDKRQSEFLRTVYAVPRDILNVQIRYTLVMKFLHF